SALLACTLSSMMASTCGGGTLQVLVMIIMYGACSLVATDFVPLTPQNCGSIALSGHVLLLISVLCPFSSDLEFLIMGGVRALLRALGGVLLLDPKKVLGSNVVISLASLWKLVRASQALGEASRCLLVPAVLSELICVGQILLLVMLVQRFVEENTEVRLEALDAIGKSHARRNLLSVLVDADITLDSNLRICGPSNKAQHFFAPDLGANESVKGMKLYRLVAEADRAKLRDFLNRVSINSETCETVDITSESSMSLQGGGNPASSMSIQMGKSGRVLQIFHASIPVADASTKPRHLVGIQEHFSAATRPEVQDIAEPDLVMDGYDAEQMYLSTQNLAEQQMGFEGRRPPSTGSRGSRGSQRSASSASSLRSSVAGLPEVGSISFIFNGYSAGLSIVEATLRFDNFDDKTQEPARVPEMKHWIRSKHWDQFRNWVQTETQRCCGGQPDQTRNFEGPLEFYYPGQPEMTLVAGSVTVTRVHNDWDSESENEEAEEEAAEEDAPVADGEGGSGARVAQAAEESQDVFDNPFIDGDPNAEVDALLVEVECKAFSQYRSLSKRKSGRRYGHLHRQKPLEPSLDAIQEGP
ncbi:unnamed protein product, partial [Effrenium voratum]